MMVLNMWVTETLILNFLFLEKQIRKQVFSDEFCKIFKDTFLYRTPPVVASKYWYANLATFSRVRYFSQY